MTALAEVLEKLERATPGPWECGAGKAYEPATTVYCDDALGSAVATCAHSMTALIPASQEKANAEAIVAAVNFLREHGPALLMDAGDGWRSIESAPKTGPVILANSECVGEARYHESISGSGWWWAGYHPTDAADGYVWQPTHWRPLPQPPAMHAPGGAD